MDHVRLMERLTVSYERSERSIEAVYCGEETYEESEVGVVKLTDIVKEDKDT